MHITIVMVMVIVIDAAYVTNFILHCNVHFILFLGLLFFLYLKFTWWFDKM